MLDRVYLFGRSGELWLAIRFAGRVVPFLALLACSPPPKSICGEYRYMTLAEHFVGGVGWGDVHTSVVCVVSERRIQP